MNAVSERYLKVSVTFERRDDGGLRVYSNDVPGFVLSGANALDVFADVVPALQFIFERNRGLKVEFGPVVSDLRADLEADGFIPLRGYAVHEFVAPVKRAA